MIELVLHHRGSGATRTVQFEGFGGMPMRPIVNWPYAGQFDLSLVDGALLGAAHNAEALRMWRVDQAALVWLRRRRHGRELAKQIPVSR